MSTKSTKTRACGKSTILITSAAFLAGCTTPQQPIPRSKTAQALILKSLKASLKRLP